MGTTTVLGRDSNQALGIGQFAVDFLQGSVGSGPSPEVLERTRLFFVDALLCGISALALRTNAPSLLRRDALEYPDPSGATLLGVGPRVKPEKAVVTNCSAVREWDSNGTNFGYNPALGHLAGEFGHNDYYSASVAACQLADLGGQSALLGMVLLDEIRGRLAEVFSLKDYKIDHVVHGAIGTAAAYGALLGATPEQIESAIGMFVAHYIPWRAIRAGKQLSDSKGASAALSAEAAVLCMKRAMAGFVGPADIFRNPESLFRQFEPTDGPSPFDLVLSHSGDDFAVMGMHFKIGLYEHQSAGGIQGLIDLLHRHPHLLEPGAIQSINVLAYQPAFGIIGDPAKRNPKTRQSADHSMVFILASILRKAIHLGSNAASTDEVWKSVMLMPQDYGAEYLIDPEMRALMDLVSFEHGGPEYDLRYPDGIPTSIVITDRSGKSFDSGIVMYPAGHARNSTSDLHVLLQRKFSLLASIGLPDGTPIEPLLSRLEGLEQMSPAELLGVYDFEIADRPGLDL